MQLSGALSVMSLQDLLQWAHTARKSGRVEFSLRKSHRSIYFRKGLIVACTADDPALLLGQFLLAHGRITKNALQDAMRLQETSGKTLGELLVQLGSLSAEQLERSMHAKAEEAIYGLFEWTDATFSFLSDAEPNTGSMPITLEIPLVLFEGARRLDELQMIRNVFHAPGVVLEKTTRAPDEPTLASTMAHRLYDLIDGKRTLRRIILESHASEYMAGTFLLRLNERGLVRVTDVVHTELAEQETEDSPERIRSLVANGEYSTAVEMIDRIEPPPAPDQFWKLLVARAESGFIAEVYRTQLPPDSVPHLIRSPSYDPRKASSELENLVASLVDGSWDVRSLVWIAPMRKVDVLRSLLSLIDRGCLELRSAVAAQRGPAVST